MLKCKICGTEFPAIKEGITLREITERSDCQVLSVQMTKKKFMILLTVQSAAVK